MSDNTARRFSAEPVRFGRRVDPAPAVPTAAPVPPRLQPAPIVTETPRHDAAPLAIPSREPDLRIFFGPNAASYLLLYRAWLKTRPAPEQSILFWHRPLFEGAFWTGLFGFLPWLFYRKLYVIGMVVLVGTIALNMLAPSLIADALSVAIGIVFMRYGQLLYIDHALRRIAKADALGFSGTNREAYLRRAGGRSLVAPLLATALSPLIAGLFLLTP
jgi:hypothetical protein